MKNKYFSVMFLVLIYLAYMLTSDEAVKVMKNLLHSGKEVEQITVVIDAGHGGRDPGKVGVNDALEKDINLSIAFKLKSLLEQNGITVIMTRSDDSGLYSETDSNKKNADLNERINIIHNNKADFAISIHQNSFGEEYVKGAQVFYHSASNDGKILAETIQQQLKDTLQDGNHRMAKSNASYYMLKKTECPLVIVECGYLSNRSEAALLVDDSYQDKLAWGIHLGIMKFINRK
ncbi:MAG: putative rane protein [Herbinix sp.]|jgi:N-acetylmuramoyl-L-alanine amidase|nr:putative rane protein [Herbinix sp.]